MQLSLESMLAGRWPMLPQARGRGTSGLLDTGTMATGWPGAGLSQGTAAGTTAGTETGMTGIGIATGIATTGGVRIVGTIGTTGMVVTLAQVGTAIIAGNAGNCAIWTCTTAASPRGGAAAFLGYLGVRQTYIPPQGIRVEVPHMSVSFRKTLLGTAT